LSGQQFEDFRLAWSKLDPKGSGFIATTELNNLLGLLEAPMGTKNVDEPQAADLIKFMEE
jgi:hypothetical protein